MSMALVSPVSRSVAHARNRLCNLHNKRVARVNRQKEERRCVFYGGIAEICVVRVNRLSIKSWNVAGVDNGNRTG